MRSRQCVPSLLGRALRMSLIMKGRWICFVVQKPLAPRSSRVRGPGGPSTSWPVPPCAAAPLEQPVPLFLSVGHHLTSARTRCKHEAGEEDCNACQDEHNPERRGPVGRCLHLAARAAYECSLPAVLASHCPFAGRGKFGKLRATARGLLVDDIQAGKPPPEMLGARVGADGAGLDQHHFAVYFGHVRQVTSGFRFSES
jgi:hypothetical protein